MTAAVAAWHRLTRSIWGRWDAHWRRSFPLAYDTRHADIEDVRTRRVAIALEARALMRAAGMIDVRRGHR